MTIYAEGPDLCVFYEKRISMRERASYGIPADLATCSQTVPHFVSYLKLPECQIKLLKHYRIFFED